MDLSCGTKTSCIIQRNIIKTWRWFLLPFIRIEKKQTWIHKKVWVIKDVCGVGIIINLVFNDFMVSVNSNF